MQATLEKMGDSRVIRVPEIFFRDMPFPMDEPVSVSLENRSIVIGVKRKTLKERLADFYGKDYQMHSVQSKEADWGTPVGSEVW